jgi:prepilin-type N-terminal cleavage/methylation domain-containing protein
MRRGAKRGGFTLVELMAVIAVIVVLAAISVPMINVALKRSRRAQAEAEIAALANAIEHFRLVQGHYPPVDSAADGTLFDSGAPGTGSLVYYLCDYALDADDSANPGYNVKGLPSAKFPKPLFTFKSDRLTTGASGVECFVDPYGRPYLYVPAKSYEAGLSGPDPVTGDARSGTWGARPKDWAGPGDERWVNPKTFILVSLGENGTTNWNDAEARYRDEDDINNF